MRRLYNSFSLVFLRTWNANGYFRSRISVFRSKQTHSFRTLLSEEKLYQLSPDFVQPIFQNIFSLSVSDVSSSQLATACSWMQQSSAALSGNRNVLSSDNFSVSDLSYRFVRFVSQPEHKLPILTFSWFYSALRANSGMMSDLPVNYTLTIKPLDTIQPELQHYPYLNHKALKNTGLWRTYIISDKAGNKTWREAT